MEITGVTSTATTSVTAALLGTARHRGSERRCAPFMSGVKGTVVPATTRPETDWFAPGRDAAPITAFPKPLTTEHKTTEPINQNVPPVQSAAVNVAIVPGPRSWSPPV